MESFSTLLGFYALLIMLLSRYHYVVISFGSAELISSLIFEMLINSIYSRSNIIDNNGGR